MIRFHGMKPKTMQSTSSNPGNVERSIYEIIPVKNTVVTVVEWLQFWSAKSTCPQPAIAPVIAVSYFNSRRFFCFALLRPFYFVNSFSCSCAICLSFSAALASFLLGSVISSGAVPAEGAVCCFLPLDVAFC